MSPVAFGRLVLIAIAAAADLVQAREQGQVIVRLSREQARARLTVAVEGGWQALRDAPGLAAVVAAGQAPSHATLNRALIEQLVAEAGGALEFGCEPGRDGLAMTLPASAVP
jgi:hypothetical protein